MNQRKMLYSAAVLVCFVLSGMFTHRAEAAVVLAQNGQPKSVIVLGNDASPSEIHGAQELQDFMQMITGAYLPIYRENEKITGTMILVGRSGKQKSVDNSIDFESLGDEGFVMRTKGGNLILAGGKLRGSMYAVYTFLEEKLGCRWYSSTASYIPKMKTVSLGDIDETQIPDFEYREPFWTDAFDPDWAARNKVNSSSARLLEQHGGKINWPGVHTFYPLMPPETWFGDHPEYYSLREERRRWEYAQLCLTNPEVMKIMTQKVLNRMEAQPNDILFEVSQNDWRGWCECEACKVIDDREEAHSGTLVPFVNAIAERTEKRFPKKLVSTLAYQYTEKAPKYAKPRYNVVIRLCNIVGCDVHPLETCEENERFRESMAGWEPITPKMYVWDYVTNFHNYLLPLPNVQGVIADIPWMLKHGVDGLFEQGCYTTKCGSLAELQAYLEAKLLWDAGRNGDEVVDEFVNGYFESAARPIKAYIDLMHKRVIEENLHHHYSIYPNAEFLDRDFLKQADAYFDEAERLADNQDIANRIARWRLSLRYAKLGRPIRHEIDSDVYRPVPEDAKYADMDELDKFIRDCRLADVAELREGSGYESRYNVLRANNSSQRIVTLENPFIKVQVVPGMGGRTLQITHKKSGTQLLAPADVEERDYPSTGGYQESPSGAEPLTFTLQNTGSGQKLVMEGYTSNRASINGYYITREIFLPADKSEIRYSYILKVNTATHSPRRISTSPVFSFIDGENFIAGAADKDGKLKKAAIEQDENGRRGMRYTERTMPNGTVSIADSKSGLGIVDTFDPSVMEYCTIGIDGENRSSIRLEGKQVPLEAGDTLELRHTIRIVENGGSLIGE